MRILFTASECFPLIKTGGLADVVGSLPPVLLGQGCDVRILIPGYRDVMAKLANPRTVATIEDLFGGEATIRRADVGALSLLLLDAPHLFDRAGGPYTDDDKKDWPDNHRRFAALSMAAAMIARDGVDGWHPDIVHAHDWQAGLVPLYVKRLGADRPKTVFTIHNIAYQGNLPPSVLTELTLASTEFTSDRLEYWGNISLLKAGILDADKVTTVSPTYAREIRTPQFGFGMEGVLNARSADLSGILNGIDETVWDPQTDGQIAATYKRTQLKRRAQNREAVQDALGLERDPGAMLVCVISRLVHQKGLDILLEAVPQIVARGGQLALLGSGDPGLEAGYRDAALQFPGRVGVRIGYDEGLSHLIYAGADVMAIPSRFEPCGLTQLYALRYGTVPLVARTGGLEDTVIDANPAAMTARTATGFVFSPITAGELGFALERAFELFADKPSWHMIQRRGMAQEVGWSLSAKSYMALYKGLLDTAS